MDWHQIDLVLSKPEQEADESSGGHLPSQMLRTMDNSASERLLIVASEDALRRSERPRLNPHPGRTHTKVSTIPLVNTFALSLMA